MNKWLEITWALMSCFLLLEEQSSGCRMVGSFRAPWCADSVLLALPLPWCGPGGPFA